MAQTSGIRGFMAAIGLVVLMAACAEITRVAEEAKRPGVAFFVATNGNDAWSGKLAEPNAGKTDGPLKTLTKAASMLNAGDTCFLREGVYRETLTRSVSGAPTAPVTFQNHGNEAAVPAVRRLYRGFCIKPVNMLYTMATTEARHNFPELVMANYSLPSRIVEAHKSSCGSRADGGN